jgi:hypothetical protein
MRWLSSVVHAMMAAALPVVALAGAVLAQGPTSAPARPAGWPTIESGAGDLRLSLPPDILISDASEAIFANEVPPPVGAWIEIIAEGPTTAFPQPTADQTLEDWLLSRWPVSASLIGPATTRELSLPAGEALEWRGTVEADPVRSMILYAIRTERGTAFVVIDGPPDRMAQRSADLDLIVRLIQVP